jgi:hypothetical protein
MNLRKAYISPSIEEVNLDVSISVLMQTNNTPPDGTGGNIWGSTGSPSTTSTLEEDDSGIKENPFR